MRSWHELDNASSLACSSFRNLGCIMKHLLHPKPRLMILSNEFALLWKYYPKTSNILAFLCWTSAKSSRTYLQSSRKYHFCCQYTTHNKRSNPSVIAPLGYGSYSSCFGEAIRRNFLNIPLTSHAKSREGA